MSINLVVLSRAGKFLTRVSGRLTRKEKRQLQDLLDREYRNGQQQLAYVRLDSYLQWLIGRKAQSATLISSNVESGRVLAALDQIRHSSTAARS